MFFVATGSQLYSLTLFGRMQSTHNDSIYDLNNNECAEIANADGSSHRVGLATNGWGGGGPGVTTLVVYYHAER